MRIDLRRPFLQMHELRVLDHSVRMKVPRVRVDVADLGRPDDLPFGVPCGDLVTLGDVPGSNPLTGDLAAVAEVVEEKARHAAIISPRSIG